MNVTRVLAVPVDRPEFEAALPPGWVLTYDEPLTGHRRLWNWRAGSAGVALIRELGYGTSTVVLVDAPELEQTLAATFGFLTPGQSLAALRAARTPLDQLRALVCFEAFTDAPERDEVLQAVASLLLDPHPAVRWAALNAITRTTWPGQRAAIEASAAIYPDMEGPAELARRSARAEAEAAAAAEREQAEAAAELAREDLLESDPAAVLDALADLAPAAAWRWRSRVWDELDRPTSAWIALYTSIGLGMRRYDDDDPSEDDDAEDVELPDSGLGEDGAGMLDVLGDACDALLGANKHATLRAICNGLKGRTRSPALRFARTLNDAMGHAGLSAAAAKLAAEFPDVAEAHWIHARSVTPLREQADAWERAADALLGVARKSKRPLTEAERAWVQARLAAATDPPGAADALGKAAEAYAGDKAWGECLRVATRGVEIAPDHPGLFHFRAVALSLLARHDDAVAAIGDALRVADAAWGPAPHGDPDPRWLLYFNRACEHALAGRRTEALADLRLAVARNAKAGEKAGKDAYFKALWGDPEFLAAAHGIQEVDPQQLARDLDFVLGSYFHGDRDEAVEVGKRALAQARILGDPAQLVRALRLVGNAATYSEGPARGVALLTEAVTLAEATFPDQPGERAEPWHLLGAAHHAARDWDAADAAYTRADALRREAGGDDAPSLAISFGDRARLAADRGAPLSEILALTRAGGDLCARVAAADEGEALEALDHATVLWSNGAVSACAAGAWAEASDLLTLAVEAFEGIRARDGVVQTRVLGTTIDQVKHLFSGGDEACAERALELRMRLLAVEEPDPAAREEVMWWAGVRGAAQAETRVRAPGQVAAAFADALRGAPPAWFTAHPTLGGFMAELPRRLPDPGSLVLVTMAFSMATDADSLDRALADLQGIAVAGAAER